MNATEHDAAAAAHDAATGRGGRILVWDLPTRLFHWLLAGAFTGAWLLSETDRWRNVHVGFGYAVLALVAARIVWGFVGSRHARFAEFAFRPRAALDYARALLAARPQHTAGHNPLGGFAIVGLLVLAVATGATGYLHHVGIGGEDAFEDLHEALATAWLALVCIHVAGVLLGSLVQRENLVRSMITGYKHGASADGIARSHAAVGAAFVAIAGVAFAWGSGLHRGGVPDPRAAGGSGDSAIAAARAHEDDDDD